MAFWMTKSAKEGHQQNNYAHRLPPLIFNRMHGKRAEGAIGAKEDWH
jgi:hypothetical protein